MAFGIPLIIMKQGRGKENWEREITNLIDVASYSKSNQETEEDNSKEIKHQLLNVFCRHGYLYYDSYNSAERALTRLMVRTTGYIWNTYQAEVPNVNIVCTVNTKE